MDRFKYNDIVKDTCFCNSWILFAVVYEDERRNRGLYMGGTASQVGGVGFQGAHHTMSQRRKEFMRLPIQTEGRHRVRQTHRIAKGILSDVFVLYICQWIYYLRTPVHTEISLICTTQVICTTASQQLPYTNKKKSYIFLVGI